VSLDRATVNSFYRSDTMARTLRLFAPPKRLMGPLLFVIVAVVIVLPLLLSIGWVLAQYAIERTSGVEFCTTCHSMDAVSESYRFDVHGGRSIHGVQGDRWVVVIHGPDLTVWEGLADDRESYVYDSGCLSCHANLLNAFPRNTEAFAAHKPYFLGETQNKCVTCHTSVGHRDTNR